MLQLLIRFSLKHSFLVALVFGGLLVFCGLKLREMPVDVFPDLNAPTVVVMTEAGGLPSDEVETTVTHPIETAVSGLPGLRRVRSASAQGLSFVWVEFAWGSDLYRARQMVAERLDSVRGALPENTHAELAPITSIAGEVMLVALEAKAGSGVTPMDLRSYTEYELRNQLLAVPGVANVVAIGGALPEYRVEVDPVRLAAHGIKFEQVLEAVKQSHSVASAGYLPKAESGRLEIPIRQDARAKTPEAVAATVVAFHEGEPVLLGSVATVSKAPMPARGAASVGGRAAVVASIQKAPGINTLDLTQRLDAAFDQAEKSMPAGMTLNREVFRASHFIAHSVGTVVEVMRDAAIIVAVILMLFLMSWRTTLITLLALPLSLAVGLLVLWAWGLSINVMTLGGFAVAVGELVDDAIIDVENVWRRLQENAALPEAQRRPATEVVFTASNEIRSSVVFATLLICMVFAPLLFLQGLEGNFFRPLGITYIVSIMASLLVALTVTPLLCKWLLPSAAAKAAGKGHHDGPLSRVLKRGYAYVLERAMRRPKSLVTAALSVAALSLALAGTFGSSFLPSFNEGTFTVFVMAPPGTSLTESDRLARGVETRIMTIPGVLHAARRTGRAERDEHAEPVSSSEIEVSVSPGHDREEVRRQLDLAIAGLPGTTTMIGQPIEHRLSHILSGTPAAIAVNLYGEDLPTLRAAIKEVEAAVKQVEGTRDVAANREVMVTSLPVRFDRAALARAGLTPSDAAAQVSAAFSGQEVATVVDGTKRYPLTVRLEESQRAEPADVADFVLHTPGGRQVRLSEVAEVAPERASNLIARENSRRKATLSCNVGAGFNLGDLVGQVRKQVDPIAARHGLTVHYGGQFEAQQSASRMLLWMGVGVVGAMFMVLQWATGSVRAAVLVMVNLPLALLGGVVAVFIAESPSLWGNTFGLLAGGRYIAPVLSVATLVGFITLFGVAVRNGLLLVNHYADLRAGGKPLHEAVRQGSMERLIPILMTALTAMLGLIPLALRQGEPGAEILAPLAIVVLGGLVSSTFLNLFVVPVGYVMVFSGPRVSDPR